MLPIPVAIAAANNGSNVRRCCRGHWTLLPTAMPAPHSIGAGLMLPWMPAYYCHY